MGLFFTLLYIFVAYLTPVAIFGPTAGDYHIEEILAVPTILFSIFALRDSGITRMNQTYGALGLIGAVIISVLLTGWLGGTLTITLGFLPIVLSFFFIAINLNKKWHLQALAALLFFVAVFVIIHSQIEEQALGRIGDYFILMRNEAGHRFYRIRGLGVINDPNDFAQYMLALLPFLFLFWKKGKVFFNLILVYIPAAVLLYGLFLTHSRGAMLALAAMCVVAARRKIGTVPSVILSGLLVLGMMAGGFTGGREVSAADGEDRMGAWGAGIEMIRTHPIFGVGATLFPDHYYMTAHNSIVVCAAETGFVGLFFWTLFVFSSLRDAWVVSEYGRRDEQIDAAIGATPSDRTVPHPATAKLGFQFAGQELAVEGMNTAMLHRHAIAEAPIALRHMGSADPVPYPQSAAFQTAAAPTFDTPKPTLDMPEIRRLSTLMLLSMVGMLSAGWFLSRAFAMLIYVFGGIAAVLFKIARENGMDVPSLPLQRACKLTLIPTFGLIIAVYVLLRVTHLLGG